ncbi:hypothetical protein [Streptomyces sp. ME19-01-6]|uniref:hypothetical protein n=1 Tax=Streptomyces sp. ME19-01-6 TaxID=3028686 RepID=UPI0029B4863A|nr:hypothetical protein [Streptomyces sp. ME19-01-6]MDX3232926.1 hypothetical protein [Streptomyces sp. ME19-01-6]
MSAAPEKVECLYAIDAGDVLRVIRFPVVKKTAKRIYYDVTGWVSRASIRFVDRQTIERDGEIRRRSGGWWEKDGHLYLNEPALPDYDQKPNLAELKAAMATAHPDRGGSNEAFIVARERYEKARAAQTPPAEGDQVT